MIPPGVTGDGYLTTFDGPARAIRCAGAIARRVTAIGLPIRAGLHTGEIEIRVDDIGGLGVHIASSVEAEAAPGSVVVSRTVKDLVVGSGSGLRALGTTSLRGVSGKWGPYAVT
ncbi:MAG: adenylate/guanylate cyclase domain-containing protein [Acidimicrobiia bacterium]